MAPSCAGTKPSSAESVVDLPPPLGARSQRVSPGRTVNDSPSGANPPRRTTRSEDTRSSPRDGTAVPSDRTGSASRSATRRTASTPSSLAWNAAPTARSGW
jgi:hypothetical protein